MVKKTSLNKSIKDLVLKYAEFLQQDGISVKEMIIFGSYARGNQKLWSDIDVCVVSSKFKRDDFKNSVFLARKAKEIDYAIEPYPYTPKDLREKYDPLANEIRKYGIRIPINNIQRKKL